MTVFDQLEALYAELPEMACQGKCQTCCGPIDMSPAERDRISAVGVEIRRLTRARAADWAANQKFGRDGEPLWCDALSLTTGKCTVYALRPAICRIWGAAESMPCPHGCKPTRTLSDYEAMDYLTRSMVIGGGMTQTDRQRVLFAMGDPETGAAMGRLIRGDDSAREELTALLGEEPS